MLKKRQNCETLSEFSFGLGNLSTYLYSSEYFFLRFFPQCTAASIPSVFSAPFSSTNCTLGKKLSMHFDHLKQKPRSPKIESSQLKSDHQANCFNMDLIVAKSVDFCWFLQNFNCSEAALAFY